MRSVLKKSLRIGVVLGLFAAIVSAAPLYDGSIEADLSFPAPSVVQSADGLVDVAIEGLTYPGKPARPELPQESFLYALPPDADLASVTVTVESPTQTEFSIVGKVRPGAPMRVSAETAASYGDAVEVVDGFDTAIYGADAFYPGSIASIVDFPKMRKWQMVRVQVAPVSYNPVQNRLRYSKNIRLTINYSITGSDEQQTLSAPAMTDGVLDDMALELISNDAQASGWYAADAQSEDDASSASSYVIITTDQIFEDTRDNGQRTLYGLVPHKGNMGYNVHVVTETSVDGSFGATGWNEVTGQTPDTAPDRIRKWLQDNYISRNIQYVLLVGNPDPANGDVPMKICRDNLNDNYEYPTDAYYGDLSGNWDLNGDGTFGVLGSDDGVGGVDFTPEVLVGRIPVYQAHLDWKDTLKSMIEKTIAYETATSIAWRKAALLPESYSDANTDGAHLAEQLKTHVLNPNGYSSYTLYQQGSAPNHPEFDSSFISDEELRGDRVIDHWENSDYGTVLWWAHGWPRGAAVYYDGTLLSSDQCPRLDDGHPAAVFMVSCTCGRPADNQNLGYSILKKGAIANVCGANVTWYYGGDWDLNDSLGMNASMGYNFNRRIVDLDQSFGQAHFLVKASAPGWRHNHLSFNLYGDPSLRLSSQASDTDGDGMPDYWEMKYGFDINNAADAAGDADNDGLTNVNEYFRHTDPTDYDTDSDGMSDGWEVDYQLNPTDDSDRTDDPDADGLLNYEEYFYQTNPRNADTDGDGMPDGWETRYGLNPTSDDSAGDLDHDGLTNLEELQAGTLPNNPDTDFDGMFDGDDNDPLAPAYDQIATAPNLIGKLSSNHSSPMSGVWLNGECAWGLDQWNAYFGYLRFNLSSLPSAAIIHGATLVYDGSIVAFWNPTTLVAMDDIDPTSSGGDDEAVARMRTATPMQTVTNGAFLTGGAEQVLPMGASVKADIANRPSKDFWSLGLGYVHAGTTAIASITNIQLIVSYEGFDSNYDSMTLAGTINGWDESLENMVLVADHVWQWEGVLSNEQNVRFKFVAESNWGINWGESNQSDFDVPVSAYAELGFSSDIQISGAMDGGYRVTFNELTGAYTVEEMAEPDTDGDGMPDSWEAANGLDPNDPSDASENPDGDLYTNLEEYQNGTNPNVYDEPMTDYDSMTLAGTFNGWDEELDNMTLVDHYTWQWEGLLNNEQSVRFKFVANSSWTINWGEANQTDQSVPMTDYAEGGNQGDVLVNHALDGQYRFTFNENSLLYTLEEVTAPDSDGDGMSDEWEDQYGLDKTDPSDASVDADGDGLTNLEEFEAGTNPRSRDTDMDGLEDGEDSDPVTPLYSQILIPVEEAGYLWQYQEFSSPWDPDYGYTNDYCGLTTLYRDSRNERPYMRFATDDLPAGASVQHAVLLYRASGNPENTCEMRVTALGSCDPVGDEVCAEDLYGQVHTNDVSFDGFDVSCEGFVKANTGRDEILQLPPEFAANLDARKGDGSWALGMEGWGGTYASHNIFFSNLVLVVNYEEVEYESDYDSMTVAGTFNGWDETLVNMHLVADYVWQYDHTFNNEANTRFKFTANSSWGVNWGENDQWQFNAPIYGTAEQTGNDILVYETLNGDYRFTFNEQSREFSFQEVGGGTGLEGIYNVHHWPGNGQLSDQDNLGVYCESHPIGEGVSAEVIYTTDGITWSTVAMTGTGIYGANDGWGADLGSFAAGTQIDYYVQVTDSEGAVHAENNGGIYYTAIVNGNGAPVEWIGNVYHWPWNGEIDSWDDLYANIESYPQGAAVSARVVYTDDGGANWYSEDMALGTPVGNNDHWYVNLGPFSSGAHVEYAIEVIDGTGASWWDSDYGNNHHAWVN